MPTNTHLDHIDSVIASKRRQIVEHARDTADRMLRLVSDVESKRSISATPIQHAETVLNTLCGELNAYIEARKILVDATVKPCEECGAKEHAADTRCNLGRAAQQARK